MERLVFPLQSARARWGLALAWSILLCILLLQPEDNPIIATGIPAGPNTFLRELAFTFLHLLAFGATCVLWFSALIARFPLRASLILAILISIAIGGATEYLQAFSPERYPSWGDFLANCAGSLIAAWLLWRRNQ